MDSIKLILFTLTILGYQSLLGDCWNCHTFFVRSNLTGRILGTSNEEQTCYEIRVPRNSFMRISILIANMDKKDCNRRHVIIKSGGEHKICSDSVTELPVTNSIVIVTHVDEFRSNPFSFTADYETQSMECLKNNIFRCSNYDCIPESQVCDGIKNCENGADEIGCETGTKIKTIRGIVEARESALSWLKNTRTPSWGWGENTPRSVVALYLASGANFNDTNLEEELMAKETELKISVALQRSSLSNNELSMFLNSLMVICHNPRNFFGNDLVKRLKIQVEETQNFTHPIVYLALCNANETWPQKAISDLLNIMNSESDYPFVRDMQAMAVMALSCERNKKPQFNTLLNSSTLALYQETVDRFKRFQQKDGSFGNVYTTAMITQALISSGEETSEDWKLRSAMEYLMKHLKSTSIDFLSAYLTLPLLNAKTLSDISKINCSQNSRKHGDDVSEISDYIGPKMRIQYSLFIGDDKDIIHTISLLIPTNYTALEVMELAEVENIKYRFKRNTVSWKVYVYEIANITNDLEAGKFWLLYLGHTEGKSSFKHLKTSIDKLVMKDGEHLIMWYKTADI